MATSNISKLFEFFSLIGQLKRVHRTGWVLHSVSDPESVADHMYRMSVLAFLSGTESGLNKERCIKMALVHDMAECIVGDIVPSDGVNKDDKHRHERIQLSNLSTCYDRAIHERFSFIWKYPELNEDLLTEQARGFLKVYSVDVCEELLKEVKHLKTAMCHITSLVSEDVGAELMDLWLEYENQSSPESLFVKDLDRFDMIYQAFEYEQLENKPGVLQEFFKSTDGKFQTETVKNWASELAKLRSHSNDLPKLSTRYIPMLSQSGHLRESLTLSHQREFVTIKPFMQESSKDTENLH